MKFFWISWIFLPFCERYLEDICIVMLTHKGPKFMRNHKCEPSFQELKQCFFILVLALPFEVDGYTTYCDTSRVRLGCILIQDKCVIVYKS